MPNEFNIQPFAQGFDLEAQKKEGQDFLSQFGAAIPQIRGQVETQLGLPGLRETQRGLGEAITGVTGQIRGIPQQVGETTRQSLVTEGQRGRLVQQQQQPLREDLVRLAESQAAISPQLSALEERASQQVQEQLLPFQAGFTLLQQQQAREESNYQFSEQLELNRLIANGDFGIRTQELAMKEAQFRNNLEQIRLTGEQARETKKAPTDLGSLFKSIFG